MAHANLVAERFISAKIRAISELAGPSLPGVGGRIYPDFVPDGGGFPAVLYAVAGNSPNFPEIGDRITLYNVDMSVKVVGKDVTKAALEQTYNYIKSALHAKEGAVTGGYIVSCKETLPYSQNYRDPSTSVRYPEIGGIYHFEIELT